MTATNSEITVAAICEIDGRFLFIEEHSAGRLVLTPPAGHVEPGESLLQAVVRETMEESAHVFEPECVCGIYIWQHPRTQATVIRINYVGRAHSHDPARKLDDGIVRCLWLERAQILAQQHRLRNPLVMRGIDDYLAGKRYPLGVLSEIGNGWQTVRLTG